jgi:outer membrane cobalamin receptor
MLHRRHRSSLLALAGLIASVISGTATAATEADPAGDGSVAASSAVESGAEPAAAAAELIDFGQISLDSLLNSETTVATLSSAKSRKDTPAILTVVTREEILRSGARDLVDLLQLVPGFQIGVDTYSSVFPGVRGMWSAEGRILVLLNGHEMHEILYMMTPLMNRFSLDWIERLEIIRGPGSAIYGGTAELAVINIVTRGAKDFRGFSISGVYGQMFDAVINRDASLANTYGRRNLSATYNQALSVLDSDLTLATHLFVGQGNSSDRVYTDAYGASYDMNGASAVDPLMANIDAYWKGLRLNYLLESYYLTHQDGYTEVLPQPAPARYTMSSLDLSYDWAITDALRLTPRLKHVYQNPWRNQDPAFVDDARFYWDPVVQRLLAGLGASWDPMAKLNVAAGLEYTYDHAVDKLVGFVDPNDPTATIFAVTYQNFATYAQALWDTPYANLSVGARYENHSQFGGSFVPRAGLTRSFGVLNLKLLASQAFHAPSIMNLARTPDVVPEKATVFEAEVGARLLDSLYVVANAFDTTVRKPILYFYDPVTTDEGYRNDKDTGSRGFELQARWQYGHHFLNVSYSFYEAAGKNFAERYTVPGDPHAVLAFSPHKLALSGAFQLVPRLSLGASAIYLSSQRYGYYAVNAAGEPLFKDFGSLLLLNMSLQYQVPQLTGLMVGLSVFNLLNSDQLYLQPYNGDHAPLPAQSREVLLKLSYDMLAE